MDVTVGYRKRLMREKKVLCGIAATVTGNIQARDDVDLTKNAFVTGSVLADDDIYLGDGTTVYGDASPGTGTPARRAIETTSRHGCWAFARTPAKAGASIRLASAGSAR